MRVRSAVRCSFRIWNSWFNRNSLWIARGIWRRDCLLSLWCLKYLPIRKYNYLTCHESVCRSLSGNLIIVAHFIESWNTLVRNINKILENYNPLDVSDMNNSGVISENTPERMTDISIALLYLLFDEIIWLLLLRYKWNPIINPQKA